VHSALPSWTAGYYSIAKRASVEHLDSRVKAHTDNAVLQALASRRSTPRVTDERPPREMVEQVIAAGAWAPNHYHTEPWRFIVVAGEARRDLGEVLAEQLKSRLNLPEGPESEQLLERERKKPLRAPIVIAVAAVLSDNPRAIESEETAAVAAGVQNMLLAAHALGLGAMWRTGPAAYDPAVKHFLSLPPDAHIVAFIYLGYADLVGPGNQSADASQHTTWLGWEGT